MALQSDNFCLKQTCRAQQKISEISEIRGLLKIIVVYKEVEAYEEQGILEDIDSDCRHSIDGTGDDADNYVMHGSRPVLRAG